MNFGKNRVQYNDFYWSFYRFENFDTYFNQDGEAIARFTGENAAQEISILEERLNHKLNKRLIFLVYNKYSDFRQSNVGLVTGKVDYNTGGVTKIINNKVSLYFQGDHQLYLKEIRAAISEVIVKEMLYGNSLSDNFTTSSMLNLPEWYVQGLTSFLAEDWNIEIENKVKDGFLSQNYTKFNRLTGEEAIYAGHSFWKYINDYYGSNVITDILYITRVNKNTNSALYNVLGMPFKDILKQWSKYYSDYFEENKIPTDTTQVNQIIKKQKAQTYYSNAKQNPDGTKIAYVSNLLGQYKIWIYDSESNKSERILKYGYKIKQINDFTNPVIEWHPTGKILTIITERKGGLKLIQYILEEKKLTERNLLYFDKILNFSYSDDGSKIVFSAVKNSKTDIYIYDIASATSNQITNDIADDFNPRFIENSSKIIFSSNRLNDTINSNDQKFSKQLDLFIYDLSTKKDIVQRLTNTLYQNEDQAFQAKNNEYYYLNDKSGIRNLYLGKFDSTINFIDTAIHYRYFLNQKPLTNYNRNIINHNINDNNSNITFTQFTNGNYSVYNTEFQNNHNNNTLKLNKYRHTLNDELRKEDSLNTILLTKNLEQDSTFKISKEDYYADINNYIFEIEKKTYSSDGNENETDSSKSILGFPKIQIYQRTFYTDHIVSQVDFSFLNSTYQAFTGGAVYFNPGFNALLKIGANDLLEDYKIIAGVRFSADFNSNEYLVSLENLKKKIDEQFVYHRQSFQNVTENFVSKTHTNKLMYIRTIPFSQVNAIKGTLTARNDKFTFLSTDRQTLEQPDVDKLWAGIKFDYIFDNTLSTGLNLYNGTRYKIFAEYYNQVNKSKTDLYVLGADFRHYQKIHRDLILATRFAASTSFGHSKLIYYLGGVDNWTNFSSTTPTFIPLNEIPINENEDYAYQAVATNLRGFSQNIRNGCNFALINTELRLPIVKYFSNYPINSSFWGNLQMVGFFDIGTAWSGLSPYSKENAYDNQVINKENMVITIDTQRYPIVAGYGFGVRAMLFGYFARFDWAWGIENQQVNSGIFYFSLSLDF
jgi:Tol biopolymer transport system component